MANELNRAILCFPNHVDATLETVSFSGGSWVSTLPLSNLSDRRLARVARSSDLLLSSTQFDVDLGAPKPVRVITLPAHTISRAGKIRVRASATAGVFTSPVYDTGWVDAWPIIYDIGALPWGHPSTWDGKLAPEDVADLNMVFIHVIADEKIARYWRFEIDDDSNAAGYVDVSRVFLAPGWQPTVNFNNGSTLQWVSETTSDRTPGGVDYYDRKRSRRVVNIVFSNLSEDEALYWPYEMQRSLGIDRQLFFIFDPTDDVHMHRRSFLATLRELSPIEFAYTIYVNVAFQLQEVL